MINNRIKKKYILKCMCSSPNHKIFLTKEYSGIGFISIVKNFSEKSSFWERVKSAIKYVLSEEEPMIDKEFVIRKEDVIKLENFVIDLKESDIYR
ncbi:MAG TPA: hypothetical protein PLU55_01315 [Candidatus Pacearchaeota archaeon]|nr:hypothetical protein [Candidatus Pacearchaeota archaeon]